MNSESTKRMLFWEGLVLISLIVGGAVGLLYVTQRERQLYDRTRLFFSNFTHDLKTSLARIRLQTDLVGDRESLYILKRELQSLDLQLENSLWIARSEADASFMEEFWVGDLLKDIRPEWPDLHIKLSKDRRVRTDRLVLRTILRNLIQNSVQHGMASSVQIIVGDAPTPVISVSDDGVGFKGVLENLGCQLLPHPGEGGNGIGLYLSKRLIRRLGGDLRFKKGNPAGFEAEIVL